MCFVVTKVSLPVATKYYGRDKHTFVATKDVFCRDKSKLVTTKLLWQQNYVCRDKSFVAKKLILMAAPANDTKVVHCSLLWLDSSCCIAVAGQFRLYCCG